MKTKYTSRLASGKLAGILLCTCGAKGLTAGILYDLAPKLTHTAMYFKVSGILTGIMGCVCLIGWFACMSGEETIANENEDEQNARRKLKASKQACDRGEHMFANAYRDSTCNRKGCMARGTK